jgi:hypothetical protein
VGIRNSHHTKIVTDYIEGLEWPSGGGAGGMGSGSGTGVKLAVEGNIGAGKSTFLDILCDERLELQDIVEVRRRCCH